MRYSDSEHVKKKQSYSDFPFALNLFVWWQFQGSASCPPIHPCLTRLSCCVRENTHENYGRVYNLNQWFLPNLEDRFLQSCLVGKVDWDFPDLRKSCVFLFYWPKYVLPYSLLASFLIQLDLKKKKKTSFVGQVENRFHSPTEQIISSEMYCQAIKTQLQVTRKSLLAVHWVNYITDNP